jgi:hypothetical protein
LSGQLEELIKLVFVHFDVLASTNADKNAFQGESAGQGRGGISVQRLFMYRQKNSLANNKNWRG